MDRQQQLAFRIRTWGGRRDGAGRPPAPGRRTAAHGRRPVHEPRCPVHVTLRAASHLPSFREPRLFAAIRVAFGATSSDTFRLLAFSVQADHLHLLVEADGTCALTRGVQGLAIRVAKTINRALGRHGPVWGERFHARALRTPREVRNALVYVLNNFRHHVPGAQGLDACSSAAWFPGWRNVIAATLATAPIVEARTWLARAGWRRHGLLDIGEAPRPKPLRRRREESRVKRRGTCPNPYETTPERRFL